MFSYVINKREQIDLLALHGQLGIYHLEKNYISLSSTFSYQTKIHNKNTKK